tara:strand:+ start:3082 stop:3603 length:522 start_codon:yes stop_codon:yes gene_type:complete
MTTSIVFDDSRMPCITDICYNSSIENTEENRKTQEWLLDPTQPRISLQGLRILKTRETGEEQQTPNITGRDNGSNVPFGGNNHTYQELKMRRKAGVLKNYNVLHQSSKREYAYAARTGSINTKHMTSSRLKQLKQSQQCELRTTLTKPASNSGVRGDNTPLYIDPSVKFYSSI